MSNGTQNQSQSPSIIGLLKDLRDETTTLLAQEVELAKAEVSEAASRVLEDAVKLAIGGAVAYAGILIALFGLADLVGHLLIQSGMEREQATWISRAGMGLILAFIGWRMLMSAKKSMTHEAANLAPSKVKKVLDSTPQLSKRSAEPTA